MHYIRRFLAGPAVGITTLGVLALTGAPAVAASAPAGAATTQATAGVIPSFIDAGNSPSALPSIRGTCTGPT